LVQLGNQRSHLERVDGDVEQQLHSGIELARGSRCTGRLAEQNERAARSAVRTDQRDPLLRDRAGIRYGGDAPTAGAPVPADATTSTSHSPPPARSMNAASASVSSSARSSTRRSTPSAPGASVSAVASRRSCIRVFVGLIGRIVPGTTTPPQTLRAAAAIVVTPYVGNRGSTLRAPEGCRVARQRGRQADRLTQHQHLRTVARRR